MRPGRRAAAVPQAVVDACAPHLPELQRIVLRCVHDDALAAVVVERAVARAHRAGELPTGPALRRALFLLVHDVLLERGREARTGPVVPRPAPSSEA